MRLISAITLSLALCTTTPSASETWLVDDVGGPGVDFVTIQAAIDAAAEGDSIEIRAGQYPAPLIVDGKSVSLLGEPGVELDGAGLLFGLEETIQIRNLQAHQGVLVRQIGYGVLFAGVLLEDNAGTVWLEDGVLPRSEYLAPSLSIRSSDSVVLSGLTIDSGQNKFFYTSGILSGTISQPMHAIGSNISIFGGIYHGGDAGPTVDIGHTGAPTVIADSTPGIVAIGGSLSLYGATVSGGDGMQLTSCQTMEARAAVELYAGAVLRTRGTSVQGGSLSVVAGCTGSDALPVLIDTGSHEVLAGAVRSMTASPSALVATPIQFDFAGEPSDAVALFAGFTPTTGLFFPQFGTELHIAGQLFPLGSLDAAGALSVSLQAPGIGALSTLGIHTQGVFLGAPGDLFLSAPRTTFVQN